jgi:hypothetical protein
VKPEPIPDFEGHPVDGTTLKISGSVDKDDLTDVVVSVDDVVQMLSQYKVVGIYHRVDPRTGRIIREQILKPVEVALMPIDPSDPNDDGIIRALPRPVPEVTDG